MTKKYKPIITDMFEFIKNNTVAGFSPESITELVIQRFPAYIAYYECSPTMYREFITQLCEYAKYSYLSTKEHTQ